LWRHRWRHLTGMLLTFLLFSFSFFSLFYVKHLTGMKLSYIEADSYGSC